MNNKKTCVICLSLILLVNSFLLVSAVDVKSFEEVLDDYVIKKWQVISDYDLMESEAVPYYQFRYAWSGEEGDFGSNLGAFWRRITRNTITVKLPAIDLSEGEWLENSHLFVLDEEDAIKRWAHNGVQDIELIYNDGGFPTYKVTTEIIDSDSSNVVINYPAVGMGSDKPRGEESFIWHTWRNSIGIMKMSLEDLQVEEDLDNVDVIDL